MAKTNKILNLVGSLGAFLWTLQLFIRAATLNNGPYDFGAENKVGNVADIIGGIYLLIITISGLFATFNLPAKPVASLALQVLNIFLLILLVLVAFHGVSYEMSHFTIWVFSSLFLLVVFFIAAILSFSQAGLNRIFIDLKILIKRIRAFHNG